MPTYKVAPARRMRAGHVLAALLLTAAGAALSPQHASAQAALGMPYIGRNHLSFYSTGLATNLTGSATTTLFGGRYGRQFGAPGAASQLAVKAQIAVRTLDGPTDGIADVALDVSWARRMDELTSRMTLAVAAGASVLAWDTNQDDATGRANFTIPATAGISYDISVGSATISPFVAPSVAWYRTEQWVNNVETVRSSGLDARFMSGASLRMKEIVLTAGSIRGEKGLPSHGRWTFAAGISF
jgi:hypothetical protein